MISITVKEVLRLAPFKGAEILTGDIGLERPVNAVTVMDAPDVVNWLKGNELVITSGYSIKDNPFSLEILITELANTNAAALGIKLRRFIDDISDSVVSLSKSLGLPIIIIPFEVSWVDIINIINQTILNKQSRLILQGERIYRRFSLSLLRKGGFPEITKILHKLIEGPVLIVDYRGNTFSEGWGGELADVLKAVNKKLQEWNWQNSDFYSTEVEDSAVRTTELENTPYNMVICPIIVESDINGHIVALEDKSTQQSLYFRIAIEQAAIMCALRTMITYKTKQVNRRFKNQLAQDLLMGGMEDLNFAKKQALFLGWYISDSYSVLRVAIDGLNRYYYHYLDRGENYVETASELLFETATYLNKQRNYELIILEKGDSLVILMPQDKAETEQHAKKRVLELAGELQKKAHEALEDLTVSIGISRINKDVTRLNESYDQASKALQYGKMLFGDNYISYYDDLGIFRILCESEQQSELREYYDETIGKLEAYDKENNSELIKTLYAFFDNDYNIQKSAECLFVHYNTVRHRLDRITEITGLDVRNSNDRLNLQVGLKIAQLLS